MRKRITNYLKYNKFAYALYFYLMSTLVNVLKIFVQPDNKLILFNSFAGRSYDDSPKAIFEEMKKDERFKEYNLVWAFHNPEKHIVEGAQKIKTDSLRYFVTALKARVWITNSSVERGLNFKGKRTLYLNTWHGTPIKKMGTDIEKRNKSFKTKGLNNFDIMNVQSRFEEEVFSKSFEIPKEHFLEVGLPRNDELFDYTEERRTSARKKLGIQKDKTAILYCPTFREYEKDSNFGVMMNPPMNIRKWEESLGHKYVLMIRAHYEVAKTMNIKENEFVHNVTEYPFLNDLIIASDVLISDYSSIFFDYAITGKPMFHFTYDYEQYQNNRGLYFDIREYLSGADTEQSLIEILKTLSYETESKKCEQFRSKMLDYYGASTKKTVECIAETLLKNS